MASAIQPEGTSYASEEYENGWASRPCDRLEFIESEQAFCRSRHSDIPILKGIVGRRKQPVDHRRHEHAIEKWAGCRDRPDRTSSFAI